MPGTYISGKEITEEYGIKYIEILDAISSGILSMHDRYGNNLYGIKQCSLQSRYDTIHIALKAARKEAEECDCPHKTFEEVLSDMIAPNVIEDFDHYEYQRIRKAAIKKFKEQSDYEYARAYELMYLIIPPKGGTYLDINIPKCNESKDKLFDTIGELLYSRKEVESVFGGTNFGAEVYMAPTVASNSPTGSGQAIRTLQETNRLRPSKPSPESILMLKKDGWSNERIAGQYPELFGNYNHKKETVRNRINGYVRGTYKGHIREP